MLQSGYGLDENGFIVSDVSLEKIDSTYMSCIRECVDSLKNLFHQQLHSIYVYGSVARGDAVVATSDLDIIAMFQSELSSSEVDDLRKLAAGLSQKYVDLVREVGIAIAYYDYTVDPVNYYENAFLTELCVCVHGEDLGEKFGPYKLSPEIAIRFNGDIREVLTRTLTRIETASSEDLPKIIQGFARKIIRTYYSMVMVRSRIWTTRLHEQADIFLFYFPEKKPGISTLFNLIEEPVMDREAVYELFKLEGEWASLNFAREVIIS